MTALIAAAVVVVVLLAIRTAGTTRTAAVPVRAWTPIDTLKDRYARGEIDHDELDRRLDRLLRRYPGE